MNLRYLKNDHDLAVQDSVTDRRFKGLSLWGDVEMEMWGRVVGTARQNISMVGCCRLPLGTASRSVRVLLKVPYLHYFSPLPRPRWMRKPVLSLCPSLCPRADLKALSGGQDQLHRLTSLRAHRGGLQQGKAHWLDLPLQPLPPCIKRRAATPFSSQNALTVFPLCC